MEEVKIIYCYDENRNPIYYTKVIKGNKYFCIDCGAELTVKEGKVKVKHLAHKNTENCGGTGESIFHKHWKENLFKAGMFINITKRFDKEEHCVEILDVLNEVSLNKRYNTEWDIEIIVDVLLVTTEGDIVVEINYKNAKDWTKLKPYYDDLKLLKVYEVTVGKNINDDLIWFDLYEKDYLKQYIIKQTKQLYRKKKEIPKKESEFKIVLNYTNELLKLNDNIVQLNCLIEKGKRYKPTILNFNLRELSYTYNQLSSMFKVHKGIGLVTIKCKGELLNTKDTQNFDVISFDNFNTYPYDKNLYIKLCNLPKRTKELELNEKITINQIKHRFFGFEENLIDEGIFEREELEELHYNCLSIENNIVEGGIYQLWEKQNVRILN